MISDKKSFLLANPLPILHKNSLTNSAPAARTDTWWLFSCAINLLTLTLKCKWPTRTDGIYKPKRYSNSLLPKYFRTLACLA